MATLSENTLRRIQRVILLLLVINGAVFIYNIIPHEKTMNIAGETRGGDFTLQSADGPVSLSDFQGKVVVLYFGYTFCPDVCPTSLSLLTLGLNQLSEKELAQVQPIFISVDPERDTTPQLKTYAQAFHPSLIGMTGSPQEIANVAKKYGVLYMKAEIPGSAIGYTVDHSSEYYVIDRKGNLVEKISHGSEPQRIAGVIRMQLKP